MIVLGADMHKSSHTIAAVGAVSGAGRRQDDPGWGSRLLGGAGLGVRPGGRAGVGAGGLAACLCCLRAVLLVGGERVVGVATRLMAGERRGGRRPRKVRPHRRGRGRPRHAARRRRPAAGGRAGRRRTLDHRQLPAAGDSRVQHRLELGNSRSRSSRRSWVRPCMRPPLAGARKDQGNSPRRNDRQRIRLSGRFGVTVWPFRWGERSGK
jgi:hypothetical protein